MPSAADSNSPAFWRDGELNILNSWAFPTLSRGRDQFNQQRADPVAVDSEEHLPMWIEAVWTDPEGILYGWYHFEPRNICPGTTLTAPSIGAVVSIDGGRTFHDLGIILDSAEPLDCGARNGFFAGGHGDFSVILGRQGKYLYFLFTNYGGPADTQGVAVARMAIEDRNSPAGAVWKYYNGHWNEPGLGGSVTPVFPARVPWERANADSFWGPSVHWNTYLRTYVALLNHACCAPGWPQEGIYVSYNQDVRNPAGWTQPRLVLKGPTGWEGWYPQIIGTRPGDSDTRAGQSARLYIHGVSDWRIIFRRFDPAFPLAPFLEPTPPEEQVSSPEAELPW